VEEVTSMHPLYNKKAISISICLHREKAIFKIIGLISDLVPKIVSSNKFDLKLMLKY